MDAWVIIVIVIAALILLGLFLLLGRKGRQRKLETRRHEAREIRREAEVGRAQADRTRAEADTQAAEARRQDALARERAAEADQQHREARDRHMEAARRDPDADEQEAAEQFDREQAGATGGAAGREGSVPAEGTSGREDVGATAAGRDSSVEHYERTQTPEEDRERRFERDEHGEVVRDEEYQEPRTNR